MTQIIKKPYLIFLLSIPIVLLIGIFNEESTLTINVHDTYFIIAYLHVAILISILFSILGFGYWLMNKAQYKLNKGLNLAHIILTFGSLSITYFISFVIKDHGEFPLYDQTPKLMLAQIVTVLLILLGLILFFINIGTSILKRKKTSS